MYLHTYVYSSIIPSSQKVETSQVSSWMDEEAKRGPPMGWERGPALTRKEALTPAMMWGSFKDGRAKLVTQSEKDRYCVAPFIAGPWRSQTHRDRAECGCQGLWSADSFIWEDRNFGGGWW